jgi:hypothetical protein
MGEETEERVRRQYEEEGRRDQIILRQDHVAAIEHVT